MERQRRRGPRLFQGGVGAPRRIVVAELGARGELSGRHRAVGVMPLVAGQAHALADVVFERLVDQIDVRHGDVGVVAGQGECTDVRAPGEKHILRVLAWWCALVVVDVMEQVDEVGRRADDRLAFVARAVILVPEQVLKCRLCECRGPLPGFLTWGVEPGERVDQVAA